MAYNDREQQILTILDEVDAITIRDLIKKIYVSEATVRRDLKKLEDKGVIIHSHGKIIKASTLADKKVDINFRENFQNPTKRLLAENAVNTCVRHGNVIILDASTTAMNTVPYLSNFNDIIVITSGLKTALSLSQTPIKFYSTGGRAINSSYSFVGQTAIDTIKSFNADVCFVSCHGLNEQGFATDTSERENELRYAILKQSKRKVLLIDSSKINVNCWHNLCNISEFDDVFCDEPLPVEILKQVKNFHLIKK